MPVEMIVDDNNQYPWTSIIIEYDEDGEMITRTVNYDNSIAALETFENGALVSLLKTDTAADGGIKPWSEILTTYNDRGRVAERHTVYDDGRALTETYDGSFIYYSIEEDLEDVANWATIETYHSDGDRITTYDNGIVQSETYVAGVLSSVVETDGFDPRYDPEPTGDGVRGWTLRATVYEEGVIDRRTTVFDNQVHQIEQFENGAISAVMQTDGFDFFEGAPPADGGAKNWEQIFTLYDEYGRMFERKTIYDNEVFESEYFQNGVRYATVQTDGFDPTYGELPPLDGGAKPWEMIETLYNAYGQIEQRETVYDDGTIKAELFEFGALVQTYQADNLDRFGEPPLDGGAKNWQEIFTRYDEYGRMFERKTIYDNGVVESEYFQNGVRQTTVQTDAFDPNDGEAPPVDGGAKPWTQLITYYDSSGELFSKTYEYDNGVVRFEFYKQGALFIVEMGDGFTPYNSEPPADGGVKPWEQISERYESNGLISSRTTVYDDGDLKTEFFQNGVLLKSILTDGYNPISEEPPADGGDSAWRMIETSYDVSGQIVHRETVFDDGTSRQQIYDDGQLSQLIRQDVDDGQGGVHDWDTSVTLYDADGNVDVKGTLFDTTDEIILAFDDDGARTTRIAIDGDDSDDWLLQITDYGAEGNTVTTYDALEDVPEIYLELIDSVDSVLQIA